jgi:hypothetical protein
MNGPFLISVDDIVAKLNALADVLAPELLPNGRRNGRYWETSNIGDARTGSYSLKVEISGDRKGLWCDYAGSKGSSDYGGNMLQLVSLRDFGGDDKKAIAWAKSRLGLDDLDPARVATVKREIQEQRTKDNHDQIARQKKMKDKARGLWFSAVHGQDTPADLYLRGRAIEISRLEPRWRHFPGALRYHDRAWCTETGSEMPAMVAAIVDLSGEMVACHRTYLDLSRISDGIVTKSKLNDAKLTMGTYRGGHIPLWKGVHPGKLADLPAGVDAYVSEGIEDGLSIAIEYPDRRVIAGVALSNIGGIALPGHFKNRQSRMVIIGQHDENEKTIGQLERTIGRQQEAGHRVASIYPDPDYKDFNDQLRGIRKAGSNEEGERNVV